MAKDDCQRLFATFASHSKPQPGYFLRSNASLDLSRLEELLAATAPVDLTAADIQAELVGNLWALAPEAFLYFLPAFMRACLENYSSLSVFAAEFLSALTRPERADVVNALDAFSRNMSAELSAEVASTINRQQLDWFDSGEPSQRFSQRFGSITAMEGRAILHFLEEFGAAHGADFPCDEVYIAASRYWSRFAEQPLSEGAGY